MSYGKAEVDSLIERTRNQSEAGVNRVPTGFVRLDAYEVWTDGHCVVVLGNPKTDDESHNCDAMGCGLDHVILKAKVSGSERSKG